MLSNFIQNNPIASGSVCDVSKPEEVAQFINEAENYLGGLDILVNSAGVGGPAGNAEDIAQMILFLCSSAGRKING